MGSEALFHAPGFDGPVDSNTLAQRLTRPESLPRPEEEQTLDVKRVEAMASAEGLLSKFFPGFEYRPEQKQMISAVTRTFGEGGHLMVEGGTGVGKSVAYLLPAILFAVANGQRVVVSTNTINLQEQLLQKDIPASGRRPGEGGRDSRRWAAGCESEGPRQLFLHPTLD